ncbi:MULTISPECIES: ribosomal protection-like ABC-F family protein [Oscillospiraceae]|uniref:ribosomal protection-like ABC-F family protein n=1 Tax=Oscillospiraceae TaxID=216572 RepID=UPI001DF3B17C|nr:MULTISPECIES: ABC-F type ribosomal protection protein [Oscillospiraceae]MBS6291236.1 ABC-F type ribosomal protection protein [Oscillibacter sp.]
MSMIDVSNLTFGYEGSPELIFDHVGFQIDSGWKLGFTGRNGRGKTTFLRLLQGEYPYSGTISASVEFEYFPYEVANLSRTGLEVVREIAPEAEDWEIQRELGLLDLAERSLELPFSSLSNGERTKVLLAAMFLKENAFLLIDEPTNHLDLEGRRKLGSYLARKRGFLLVSHDRAFLDQCVDHILAINRTNIEIQRGNFSSWWENRRRQDAFELARQEKLQKDIGRLTESARRASGWSDWTEKSKFGVDKTGAKAADRGFVGHKAAKLMQRSKSIQRRREEAVEEKKQLLQNLERQEALAVTPLPCRTGARLAEFRDVAVCYNGRRVCREITFEVLAGERIALQGANGCGKSSLLKLLLGEEIPHSGTVETMSGLVVSYVSQNTDHLRGSLTEFVRTQGLDGSRFRTILRKLDVPREQFEKDLADYSSGQKKKVLLAASLCTQAHLYVWDEPLNFIDVISRMQVEDLLLACRPTLLFVEHDARFCDEIATRRIRIQRE